MMKKGKRHTWLNTPYYFNPSIKFKLKTSLNLGGFVFVFLYVFKPFSLSILENLLLEYALGVGVITFIGTFFMLYVPSLIFKDFFNEDRWTIGKNILLIFFSLILVGSVLWYGTKLYKEGKEIASISYFTFLTYTFLVGAIPIFFKIYINEKNVREKRERRAEQINTIKRERASKLQKKINKDITIYSDNKKESINFNIDTLVYITCQGNYASFFIIEKDILKEKILRATLLKTNEKLEDYSNIIRCHKSYIINTNFVIGLSGNARGYLLKMRNIDFEIPVSRNFSKQSLNSLLS